MHIKSLRFWVLCALLLALAAITAVSVLADDNIDPSKKDGRINEAEHVGGNAVYCVDHTWTPTSDGWEDGGIRVLNGNGQEIFFASAAEIDAVGVPAVNTLLKTEGGLSLYRQPDGGFSLNGLDEWGKPYTFVFYNCVPIGPIPYTHAEIPTVVVDPCTKPSFVSPQVTCLQGPIQCCDV